jgi:hypothetical protein
MFLIQSGTATKRSFTQYKCHLTSMLLNVAGQNVNIKFRKKLQNVKKVKSLNNLVYEYLPQGGGGSL